MSHHRRDSITSRPESDIIDTDLDWPFGKLEGIDQTEIRESAYEIFFISCRSTKNATTSSESGGDGSPVAGGGRNGVGMVMVSKIKRMLGLKAKRVRRVPALNASPPVTWNSCTGTSGGGGGMAVKVKRPLTAAELMRQQMRVSEVSDNRLRKTVTRILVGQNNRRAETIILPLELLRHLKHSEFNDLQEYHQWQRRQLKILEAGLLLYPSVPLPRANPSTTILRDLLQSIDTKPIDVTKNPDTLRNLINSVTTLAGRNFEDSNAVVLPSDVCHWTDGFPLNLHLYVALLRSIFDIKEETMVLDEVDELLELIKKTWSTFGIDRSIHNLCLMWVFFERFVISGQVEPDLLGAGVVMLNEVANDVRKTDKDGTYMKILSSSLVSMQKWVEKRLVDYHEWFNKVSVISLENIMALGLKVAQVLEEEILRDSSGRNGNLEVEEEETAEPFGDRTEFYIRSSSRNAFAKLLEREDTETEVERDTNEALIQLAKQTEELASREKEVFSPILKKLHPLSTGIAVVTLHNCYGVVLKQYLSGISNVTKQVVRVLQVAGKLERGLVQMIVEDIENCEDEEDGNALMEEIISYEVDTILLRMVKVWIDQRLNKGRECLARAKEIETWNPKSKTEPHAQSAMELTNIMKYTVDEFMEIPTSVCDILVQDLADGLENLMQDYISFVSSCGLKQNYLPSLPPLTRCNQDPFFVRLWKKTCKYGMDNQSRNPTAQDYHPRPSTSRGTQRLYIRLNTLEYLLTHVNSLDHSLTQRNFLSGSGRRINSPPVYFDLVRSAIPSAIQHVSEVAAYRLIFFDSKSVFYDGLYINGNVSDNRIRPILRALKQNLTLLTAVLTDRVQAIAVKEVMKASFDAFLMVLLAGGSSRAYVRSDHSIVYDDFEALKKVFCSCGDGMVSEEIVGRESKVVEGMIKLMGQSTEQLLEDFSIATCENCKTSDWGITGVGEKLVIPAATRRWNCSDPTTILRVLCYRNDPVANGFLKKNFNLPKRR